MGRETKKFIARLSIGPGEIRDQVVPFDFVPQADLPAIYRLARFFLFPSMYESFGIPITEAMASGCRVITSTDGACPEVVGSAGMLVDPKNVTDIADAIDRLAFNGELRQELSDLGLMRARRFNWDMTASKTVRVFKEMENHRAHENV